MAKDQSPGEVPARRRPGKIENITSRVSRDGGAQSGILKENVSLGHCMINSGRGGWGGEEAD